MILVILFGSTAAIYAGETVAPKSHPDSSNWQELLAKDLSNAVAPEGVWSLDEGVLTAAEDWRIARCCLTLRRW
ncbi:MAG: hypothetical protein HUU20_05000 [Pirellulales bacterium]|nr:hypothetical protein [Pirellulales bacterium]